MANAGAAMLAAGVPVPDDALPLRPRDLPAVGVGLADVVGVLQGAELADLPDVDLLGAVVGWEQVVSWAVAAQGAVVGELVARRARTSSYPVDDLACALATTSRAASALVSRADGLATHPVLADGLRAGVLDVRKADALLDEVARLPEDDADRVLRAAVADAAGLTGPLLRRRTRRLVAALDPDAARKRAAQARSARCVRLEPAGDDMAWVSALLPAPDAVAVFCVIDALAAAAAAAADPRTLQQRRADAFGDVFADILATGTTLGGVRLPTRQGSAAGIHLTVAASTLAGRDDLPGELDGYGPIPAAIARDLAAHAERYRPAVIDPDGHLLALATHTLPMPHANARTEAGTGTGTGHSSPPRTAPRHEPALAPPPPTDGYRPSAELRRYVITRDQTCAFPGCRQPATACDLDHIDPYDPERTAVEQTIADNLQPLCRHHHRTKTHHGWHLNRNPHTGDTITTSPTGTHYLRPATTILLTPTAYQHTRTQGAGSRAGTADQTEDELPPPF
jgi:hypothetical protein